jgi:hypothetical protein
MGAGAGQTGGGMQQMPQMGQMPPGVPTQGGISALAAQGAQMDPRLAAIMQAMQQQGGMPGGPKMGTFGPNDMPSMPNMPMPYDPRKPDSMIPGGVPVQRPLPVGAGGKGTGMPPPGMGMPPDMYRGGPATMPPFTMVNPSRPMPKPQTMAPNLRPGFSGFR